MNIFKKLAIAVITVYLLTQLSGITSSVQLAGLMATNAVNYLLYKLG